MSNNGSIKLTIAETPIKLTVRESTTRLTVEAGTLSAVVKAPSATDNAFVRFDGTSGRRIQDSNVIADDEGNVTTPGDINAANAVVSNVVADSAQIGVVETSSLDVVNNITVGGTVDGRDVAADGALLDARLPTADEKAALAGTGTPSAVNKYVTDNDSRLTNARTPTAHAASHVGGSDPIAVATGASDGLFSATDKAALDARLPTSGEKAALAGTSGTPGNANKFVTDTDTRNTNARTPTAHASSHVGGADAIAVATTSVAGLLSAADKTKLDALPGSVGDVDGPASSTLNAIPLFADTTGKVLKDSVATIDADALLDGVNAAYHSSVDYTAQSSTSGTRIPPTATYVNVNAGNNGYGVLMPAWVKPGRFLIMTNTAGNTFGVYPASGDKFQGLSTDANALMFPYCTLLAFSMANRTWAFFALNQFEGIVNQILPQGAQIRQYGLSLGDGAGIVMQNTSNAQNVIQIPYAHNMPTAFGIVYNGVNNVINFRNSIGSERLETDYDLRVPAAKQLQIGSDASMKRIAAAVLSAADASTGIGAIQQGQRLTAFTQAASPVAITRDDSGRCFSNASASGSVTFNLPAPTNPGSDGVAAHYDFVVRAAQALIIDAPASVTIRYGTALSAASGNIQSNETGARVRVQEVSATEYEVAMQPIGTWDLT